MLNSPATRPTTIATLPKQQPAMPDLNHREVDDTTPNISRDNKVEHNTPTSLNQYVIHESAHSNSASNQASNPVPKESQMSSQATEIASATNMIIPPSADTPQTELAPGVGQSSAQGEPYPEERESSATGTSSDAVDLLALYPSDSNPINNELAIPTDEDGLYALKL
jgi:hypothetical protein